MLKPMKKFGERAPDYVVVYGVPTPPCRALALPAAYPCAHVERDCASFNRRMPEKSTV